MFWRKKSRGKIRLSAQRAGKFTIKNSLKCLEGLISTPRVLQSNRFLGIKFEICNEIWYYWLNLKRSSMIWRKKFRGKISGAARIWDQKLVKMSWRIDFHSTLFSRQQILMNRIWGDEIWIEAVRCCDSWMFSLLLLKMITIMVFLGIGKINVIKRFLFHYLLKKWTRNSFTVPV